MGYVVFALSLGSLADPSWWLAILLAALGLGAVIFVHELGHFAVAKWCGVKCEKFYLGFDIYGLKLFKYKYGETEYGIGILPLGGYVKMLGQDDNPSNQAGEIERSKTTGEKLDPRSYLAKSVPQRMAIISAGVIMNLIFAFIFCVWAFSLGVEYIPCAVSNVSAGDPAWTADIRPGDEIVAVDGIEKPRFDADLLTRVTLANMDDGVTLGVSRPGVSEPMVKVIKPRKSLTALRPSIGITSPSSLIVFVPKEEGLLDDSFARAEPAFKDLDKIIKADGQTLDQAADLKNYFLTHRDKPVQLTVERKREGAKKSDSPEQVTITVPPTPSKLLGLVMEIGPIVAVQENSPASQAGLKAGDTIVKIDGQPVGDPLTLADRLRAKAGKSIKLEVTREKETLTLDVTPREAKWSEPPLGPLGLASAPPLGIAYKVENRVASVEPGSAADKAGVKPGAVIASAEFIFDKKNEARAGEMKLPKLFEFSGEGKARVDWPAFTSLVQNTLDGTKIQLVTTTKDKFELEPVASSDRFEVDRGMILRAEKRTREAASFGEAIALGARETKEDVLLVYRFLQKLVSGQVSVKMLRGPLTIGYVAHDRAGAGFSQLLIFLAVLSANLAVVNFLPIPVLDGGHMVFLALEGLRGKPVSEGVIVAFHYAGLCFILSLMVFVLSMDVGEFWVK